MQIILFIYYDNNNEFPLFCLFLNQQLANFEIERPLIFLFPGFTFFDINTFTSYRIISKEKIKTECESVPLIHFDDRVIPNVIYGFTQKIHYNSILIDIVESGTLLCVTKCLSLKPIPLIVFIDILIVCHFYDHVKVRL